MTPRRSALAVALVAAAVLATGTSSTLSGWTAAVVANSGSDAANGSLAFSHSYPGGSCSITARGSGTVTCAGSVLPAATITPGGVSATDTLTNNGTLAAARLASDVRALSCGPVSMANTKTAADPVLPRYGAAFAQTDPWGTAGAVTFSSNGYAADVVATNTGTLLGSSYSLGVWFKVASGYAGGGPLMSLAASPVDGSSTASSPMIWMDTAGKIRYRVTGTLGTSSSGVSAAAYNDGSWHLAILSVAAVLLSTPTLYVDSAAGVTGLGLAALTGGNAYWHLGWADFTGVAGAPAATLPGSLAGAFATSSTVSSATRTSLFGAASASAYSTLALGLTGVTHLWMLGDSGTGTYAGTLPVIGATSPCTMADLAWSATSPSGTISSAGTKLSAFADGSWHTITAPGPAGAQSLLATASRDATWDGYIAGLRLYVPIQHRIQSAPTGSSWSRTFSFADSTSVVIG